MSDSNLLSTLNDKQREVVTAELQHLAVIAGAGSGKTRALVHRIAWLIQVQQISAARIFTVTFTNKAAAEMRDRIEGMLGLSIRGMWIGTFHGIAHRFLRAHWQPANLPETFQILDSDDQLRLIRRIHSDLKLNENQWPTKQSQWYINNKKDAGLRPHQIETDSQFDEVLVNVYKIYEELCARGGLVDFAELLLRSYEVLQNNPELLEHYRNRFAHILVDEFQDTNAIQYSWLRLLAGPSSKLMIVGDDDQSIYSWRGAQIENIHRFNRDFSARVIRLDQNYRSTKTILAAANSMIAYNRNRVGKDLWTDGCEGEPISLYMAFNEIDEARYIVSQIKSQQQQGNSLRDVAILYRSNAQSRILEEELIRANLPYRIYGGLKFFERAEIKDALAYLRLISNLNDDDAFERIVNTPTRGIGNTTLSALRDSARHYNLSLWQTSFLLIERQQLNARSSNALNTFLQLILRLQDETKEMLLSQQTEHVLHQSGLYEHYKNDRSDKMQSRVENLQELVQATRRFILDDSLKITPLQSFLSYVALESGDAQAEQHEDCIQLMTFHSAKGLEFSVVFLTGMEEGLFPHKMSLEEGGRLEEERRLCYVGMTRARKKLYFSHAESRRRNGSEVRHHRSRFINEIPSELLDEVRVRTVVSRPTSFATNLQNMPTDIEFQLGQRVLHRTYGEGIVLNYEGRGQQAIIHVKFSEGIKRLVAEYAKLEAI